MARRHPPRPMSPYRPGILVFNEKHGKRYFSVPTENHLHAAALKVLTDRFNDTYWYYDPMAEKPSEYDPEPPQMTDDEIEKLPEGAIREAATEQRDRYNGWLRRREAGHETYMEIKHAIEHRDGALAWQKIQERGDHEYEGYYLEGLDEIEPVPRPENPEHYTRWTDPETGQRWIYEAKQGLGWIKGDYARMTYNVQAHKGQKVTRVSDPE